MKKILTGLLLFLLFSACGTLNNTSDRAKKLELGMTKKEVINIMGKGYRIVSASQTPEGALETLRYESSVDYDYMINLLNGKLVEWYEERPHPQHQHQHQQMKE